MSDHHSVSLFWRSFRAIAMAAIGLTAWAQERPVTIRAGLLLDGKGGALKNKTVLVQHGRIRRIDPATRNDLYDLSNYTVMPGWIDTHVHIGYHFDKDGRLHTDEKETPPQSVLHSAENAYATLIGGFTTVQSLGAPLDGDLRDAIARGILPGPRVLTSLGAITEADGTPEQIRAKVRAFAADGADAIKIFATKSIREGGAQSMTDAQIQAACGEAANAGKRAVVHAQASDGARAAILAGCTSIEHGNQLSDAVLELMAQHGTYFDPNVGLVLQNYLQNKDRFLGIGNYNAEGFAYMQRGIATGLDTFRRALAKRVKIVFGTDAVAGAHGRNAEEFVVRVQQGGQKPMDAMVSAMSLAAESLGLQDQIGSIAVNMQADLIALDGNPLEDITAVRRVVFVMRGGKVLWNVRR